MWGCGSVITHISIIKLYAFHACNASTLYYSVILNSATASYPLSRKSVRLYLTRRRKIENRIETPHQTTFAARLKLIRPSPPLSHLGKWYINAG